MALPGEEPGGGQYYNVELHRSSRGFGFSIRGGQEFGNMPLYVLRIADGSAAELDGRLQVGAAVNLSHSMRLCLNSKESQGVCLRILTRIIPTYHSNC